MYCSKGRRQSYKKNKGKCGTLCIYASVCMQQKPIACICQGENRVSGSSRELSINDYQTWAYHICRCWYLSSFSPSNDHSTPCANQVSFVQSRVYSTSSSDCVVCFSRKPLLGFSTWSTQILDDVPGYGGRHIQPW